MIDIRNKYNLVFITFLFSVLVSFCLLRPFNSGWHRFIAGDGLGYYSYLPAQFIYNDSNLNFKWFNAVYKKHYPRGTFENPEDNFMVSYGAKKINKYYQGLSVVWLPFFALAHLIAHFSSYPADGFSEPYQWMMGFASVFYLLAGLWFLKKLLYKITASSMASALSPVFIYYGSYLFNYAVNYNTLSHVYSFTFMVLFCYTAYSFFNEAKQQYSHLFLCLLFLLLSVCIRPLNLLAILMLPAFYNSSFKQNLPPFKAGVKHLVIALAGLAIVIYQARLNYIQTGSLLTYTYGDEGFHFKISRFFDSLFSYHLGLFVYAPVMLISFFGILFFKQKRLYALVLVFLLMSFVYASWWYWPIVKRALLDYYLIPAILLSLLLSHVNRFKKPLLFLLTLSCLYYQFKEMQIRRGVLSEFLTYKEVFWRNFFRTQKANLYLVPPSSVLKKEELVITCENNNGTLNLSTENPHAGSASLLLGPSAVSATLASASFPSLFNSPERKKIRLSFWSHFEEGMGQVHVFIRFYGKNAEVLREEPFYLSAEDVRAHQWDYKEFGCEVEDTSWQTVEFLVWNTEGKKKMFIDDVKVEFMLCDNSFETIK